MAAYRELVALAPDRLEAARMEADLGWVAMNRGDAETARSSFESAFAQIGRPLSRSFLWNLALLGGALAVHAFHRTLAGRLLARKPKPPDRGAGTIAW